MLYPFSEASNNFFTRPSILLSSHHLFIWSPYDIWCAGGLTVIQCSGAKMMLSLPSLLAGVMDLAIMAIDIYADMLCFRYK